MKEVDALVEAKAEIIALDLTDRKRGDGKSAAEYFREVREKYPQQLFLADISNFEEGKTAMEAGVDFVSTTMSGYTPESPELDGPDYELVERLAKELSIPVFAEGRIHTPEEAGKMLELGAFAVIVGGAITRPLEIAERFMYYIYYQAFKLDQFGYGNAMGIILAIIIAIFSAIQFKAAKSGNG